MKTVLCCIAAGLMLWLEPCNAQIDDIQIVKGECENTSHIAEGQIGDDLTKRQSRFFCDSAVMTFFDNGNRHIMVQFVESKSVNNMQLGFSGLMEDDGRTLNVTSVYLGNKKIQGNDITKCLCTFVL